MRVARWGQTHCCLKFWLHTREPSALSRPNMRRSFRRFNHHFRNTRVVLPPARSQRSSVEFPFFDHDFSRHGTIGSHKQDIDCFPSMLLQQRHCHMPIPREAQCLSTSAPSTQFYIRHVLQPRLHCCRQHHQRRHLIIFSSRHVPA